jgi:hypothetical protein
LRITSADIAERLAKILRDRSIHVAAIDDVIEEHVDKPVGDNIKAAGGGAMIFEATMSILQDQLKITGQE